MSPRLRGTPGDCRGLQGTRRGNGFGGESSRGNGSRAPSLFSQNLGRGFDSRRLHQEGDTPLHHERRRSSVSFVARFARSPMRASAPLGVATARRRFPPPPPKRGHSPFSGSAPRIPPRCEKGECLLPREDGAHRCRSWRPAGARMTLRALRCAARAGDGDSRRLHQSLTPLVRGVGPSQAGEHRTRGGMARIAITDDGR